MATVTATNGEVFFVWPLPAGSARQVSPGIGVNDITNDLGNGYSAQTLYGSDTGLRTWQVTQNTMGGTSFPVPTVTGIHGGLVTQEKALWDLYLEQRVTGKPFVYPCPREGRNFLVKFDNPNLTYDKVFRVDQYSAQLSFSQVREDGVTIFDLENYAFIQQNYSGTGWLFNEDGHFSPNWANEVDGSNVLTSTGTGTPTFGGNAQNGHNTVRFDGTTDFFSSTITNFDIADIIVALTVREATFGGNDGLFLGSTSIKGTSGGTKWQNPSITNFEYSLNGFAYEVTDMQAPMDGVFGVCHFRFSDAYPFSNPSSIVVGVDSSAFIAADIGEIYISSGQIPMPDAREIIEHLCIKWAANT